MNRPGELVVALFVSLIMVASGACGAAFAQNAQKFTACVSKKGKIKFLQEGNAPLKECKGKQIEIMFPSTEKTDLLMDDLANFEAEQNQLNENVRLDILRLEGVVTENKTEQTEFNQIVEGDILDLQGEQDTLKNDVRTLLGRPNFSYIGGSTGNDSFCCSNETTIGYMGPFVSRLGEDRVQVQQSLPPEFDEASLYNFQISVDHAPGSPVTYTLFPGGSNNCTIGLGETNCSVNVCEPYAPGEPVYVMIEAEGTCPAMNPNCVEIPPSRWITIFEPAFCP